MAATIGIRELRNNLTATIRRVRAGETIEVTNHGEPVAVLSPPPEREMDPLDRLIAEGRATPAKNARFTYGPPKLKNVSGIPTEEIISEGRKDFWED